MEEEENKLMTFKNSMAPNIFLTWQVSCRVCYQVLEIGVVYRTVGGKALVMRGTLCDQNFLCMTLTMRLWFLLLVMAGKKEMTVKTCNKVYKQRLG